MMQELIQFVESQNKKETAHPIFKAGDTINVHVLIKEGEKERTQQFKGVCIQRKGEGATAVELVDGERLVSLFEDKQIGLRREEIF